MRLLLLLFAGLIGASASAVDRPNILFIMTDDQGYWDTGATGNPHIDTPHIDSLASDGTQFSRYYAAPVCAPTRAGVMTGRYYLRTGLYNTRFGGDSLGTEETTVAEFLKELKFTHPENNEIMQVKAPLDEVLLNTLEKLKRT